MKGLPSAASRLAITVLAVTAVVVTPAAGHVAYDSQGRFMHQAHSRDFWFLNDVSASGWRDRVREAQIHHDNIFNGSIRFDSTSSHDRAVIHAVDDHYDASWVAEALWWSYHGGHGHLRINNNYNFISAYEKRVVGCHEIGHFTGLDHSLNATDCMHTYSNQALSDQLAISHRDSIRSAWNAWGH